MPARNQHKPLSTATQAPTHRAPALIVAPKGPADHRAAGRRMGMKGLPAALLLASLCACVPVYKTLQPAAQAQVLDEQGKPLNDAQVTLISSAYPYGREQFRTEATTRGDGTAAFYPVRDLRIEVLMLHGSQEFFWNWCVSRPGYKTYLTENRNSAQFVSPLRVTLQPGQASACPTAPY